jgi:signal transduction histidine kinase
VTQLVDRPLAVAWAAHELRGAICAVRLGVELAAREGQLPQQRLRALELELSRAELALEDLDGGRPAFARQRVDVRRLLVDSVEAWRGAAAERDVELRLRWRGPAACVRGDRIRLAQATGNLIANAIEHAEGPVEVSGGAHGHTVRVEVTDSGAGLPGPVSDLASGSRRAGHGRRGHGLAIACEVAGVHGGRVAAAPSNRGARLVLELPLLSDATKRAATARATSN